MKILLVFPYYPPDKGVSTFRAVSFFNALSKDNVVKVLKPGNSDDFSSTQIVNTINSKYIKAIASAIIYRKHLTTILKEYLMQFDCIIVSVPIFSLCMIAVIARKLGIPVIVDIRDHPNLVYFEMTTGKNTLYKFVRWLIWKGTESLLTSAVKKANAIMCVGVRSCEYQIQKTPLQKAVIYNVHNGFEEHDWQRIEELHNTTTLQNKGNICIGVAGSIHRFRDTPGLRTVLKCLDEMALKTKVQIEHWGILSIELTEYLTTLKNISYHKHGMLKRQEYLEEIVQCNLVLLACSDSLIWEPTTTVFDYLLLGKPIIFVGDKGNEAYRILKECDAIVLSNDQLNTETLSHWAKMSWEPNREIILRYSRENQNKKMINILNQIIHQNRCNRFYPQ